MKKFLCAAMAALLACGILAGCGGGSDEGTAQNRLEQIKAAGKIVVATSPDFPPSEFIDASKTGQDQYQGYEMTVARYIAEQLGVELEIKAMDFKTVLTSVGQGTVDLAISGLAPTEDRKETMEFTQPVRISEDGHCIVVRKEDADKYTSLEDFNGVTVGAQISSLQAKLLTEQTQANMENVNKINEGVLSLKTKRIDGLAMSEPNAKIYCSKYPDDYAIAAKFDYDSDGACIAVPKGEAELLNAIDEIITQYKQDPALSQGWYDEAVEYAASLLEE